ncbi:MAG: hypothetical protein ACRCWO_04130 [Bosea sp. (in: a-proteobacteria)]
MNWDWPSFFNGVSALGACAAAFMSYLALTTYRESNLHSEQIKKCADIITVSHRLGQSSGQFVGQPNLSNAISDLEIHMDPRYKFVWETYLDLRRDLRVMKIIGTQSLQQSSDKVIQESQHFYAAFTDGIFFNLNEKFLPLASAVIDFELVCSRELGAKR